MHKLRQGYTGLFKILTFGFSSGIGFLVAETILTIGVLLIFGSIKVKTDVYASPVLLGLDILALCIGVTVSFFINQTSFKWASLINPSLALFKRLLIFQLVSVGGSVIIIVVQLLLLKELSIAPSIGNVIGIIVTFPPTYLFSMRYVWKNSNSKIIKKTGKGEIKGNIFVER